MRTARETSALRATSKSSNFRKVYLALAILDSITREDVYVIFVEVVNKMEHKYADIWRKTDLNVFLY